MAETLDQVYSLDGEILFLLQHNICRVVLQELLSFDQHCGGSAGDAPVERLIVWLSQLDPYVATVVQH